MVVHKCFLLKEYINLKFITTENPNHQIVLEPHKSQKMSGV
jgi:hypothetical protein